MYEFCLSSCNFESAEAVDTGLVTLATNFLYSVAIFSVQKNRNELSKNVLNEDEEDKMIKVWRLIFNKRENDVIKENQQLLEFVNKYSQDIKTLFNLLRKDKISNKFVQRVYKAQTSSRAQDKENADKLNKQSSQKLYKIKHHRSGLNNKHNYVVRLSTTTQGAFKVKTDTSAKFNIKNGSKKLTTAKSFPVDIDKDNAKIERKDPGQNRALFKLNTVDLGNTLFK